jgi:predicted  nucleic acid-binding Zn-ribbon protein
MNPQLQRLIELQKTDSEITELEKAKAAIPHQIESGKTALKEKQGGLKEAQDVLAELQKKRKDLEMEVATENDHIAKTKSKLPAVKTNKEYTAILHEVDAVKEKISVLEDKELELMETMEEKEKELSPLKALCKEEEENFKAYKSKKEAEAERTEGELEVLRARRHATAGAIEEKLLGQYNKVIKARDSLAVVTILDNVCQGCHQQVLPQQVIDVKVGETINHCEQCLRILYWEENPETAVPK